MRKYQIGLFMVLVGVFTLAACTGSQTVDTVMDQKPNDMANNEMMDENENAMADEDIMEENENVMDDEMEDEAGSDMSGDSNESMEESDQATDEMMAETPAWFDYEFTNADTGQTFTINDFKGKVVLLETMAMWCSNCMKQQREVKELHNLLGEREDFVGVGIDVDLNEDLAMLAQYINQNGFDWSYSIANQEVLSGISESLGGQFLNPPSTPIVIIDKEGNLHPLPFGIKSADTLLEFVQEHLN